MKRFRPSRELIFLAVLLLLLAGFTAFVAARQQELAQAEQVFTPYSSHSARDSGTLALYEWANALGYRAQRIENSAFRVADDTRLLFVFAPRETIEPGEARYLLQWVERGNVLVVADSGGLVANGLLRALEIETTALNDSVTELALSQPLADANIEALVAGAYRGLETRRNDIVPYAAADKPALLRIARGQGTLWVLSAPMLLNNEHLANADNAKFARALLASVPSGSAIAFDEYHLGFKSEYTESLLNVIYNTPWGWGLLFAAIVLFGYLILNGQRLGRTVPVQKTLARRTPSEYVVSMANLFRRANQRGMVLQHYRHSLKRRLGRPFHLNPDVPDERYIELITRVRPEIDRAELVRLLNGLRRTDTSEADLIKTVEHAVTFGTRKKK
jgi:hypothetical protein